MHFIILFQFNSTSSISRKVNSSSCLIASLLRVDTEKIKLFIKMPEGRYGNLNFTILNQLRMLQTDFNRIQKNEIVKRIGLTFTFICVKIRYFRAFPL